MDAKTLDALLLLVGVFYGAVLIACGFVDNRLTRAFRIDALFMSRPSQKTRMMNIPAGILMLLYSAYSLWKSLG